MYSGSPPACGERASVPLAPNRHGRLHAELHVLHVHLSVTVRVHGRSARAAPGAVGRTAGHAHVGAGQFSGGQPELGPHLHDPAGPESRPPVFHSGDGAQQSEEFLGETGCADIAAGVAARAADTAAAVVAAQEGGSEEVVRCTVGDLQADV